jgi:hypothetical protein
LGTPLLPTCVTRIHRALSVLDASATGTYHFSVTVGRVYRAVDRIPPP